MSFITQEQCEEANERQLAELDFVESAYTPDEAWTNIDKDGVKGRSVTRLLQLPVTLASTTYDPVVMELHLEMPPLYPINKDSYLMITSSLKFSPANPPLIRKAALNAITPLNETCQSTACEFSEHGEALLYVFNAADEWVERAWPDILSQQESMLSSTKASDNASLYNRIEHSTILGRRCIYSHHIIANSKRKNLASLAHSYKLGGYVKIGWPGIIIFEGLESSCQAVVDEIKTWRWQHLSIRVEETSDISDGRCIDEYRRLPKSFHELGEDDMSMLAQYCREAGLEHMFLQCLKIDNGTMNGENLSSEEDCNSSTYAALVHVDHMNDRKFYEKWLRKESEAAGCTLFVKHCISAQSSRPLIYVGMVGEKDGVKRILKHWRTNRVDVDSKGKPCLERMMSVLMEGEMPKISGSALERLELLMSQSPHREDNLSPEHMRGHIRCIFGDDWAECIASSEFC